MELSPRKLGAALTAAALGAVGLGFTAHANASFGLTRVAGSDRYATASAVAANAFTGTTPNVVIARGDQFPDALAGAYLAGILGTGAPVLLTTTDAVPTSTKDRLAALGAKNVYLLGGTTAISQAVQDDLGKSYTVTRIAGSDRFDTASKVAQQTNTAGVGTVAGAKTAIIASGATFPDALAAGSPAFAARFPIVLTNADALPSQSTTALSALGIKHALIVGGTSVVNSSVVNQLTTAGITSERIAGNDRYETSTKLADWEASNLTGWSTSQVDLANGDVFADALAGGPAAGRGTRPILLTASTGLSAAPHDWLAFHSATLLGGRVFGGTAAVSDATVTAAETAAGGGVAPQSGQVTSADKTNHRYTLVPTGATAPLTVNYKASDTYSVDGTSVPFATFETALTVADNITYTPVNGTTPASHVLTNVNPSTIKSGTVGAVAENAAPPSHTFKFVNPVTGDALTPAIDYSAAGNTFTIDGAASTLAGFGGDISEGDTVTITGTAFALTNGSVSGAANTITHGNALNPTTTFKIGFLGDNPTAGDSPPLVTTNDTVFSASGASGTTDVYTGEAADWAHFDPLLTDGDTVTYSRKGGHQTFNLVNQAPTKYSGQATGTDTTNPVTKAGSFTLATATKAVTINYTSAATFKVNGAPSDQATFEADYSPGDLINYQAADASTSTAESMELTDQNVAGMIPQTGVNTTATPSASGQAPHTYQVLASNGFTVLTTVTYADGTPADNVYVVDGATVAQTAFETKLNDIAAGKIGGSVVVTKAGSVQTHTLTTNA